MRRARCQSTLACFAMLFVLGCSAVQPEKGPTPTQKPSAEIQVAEFITGLPRGQESAVADELSRDFRFQEREARKKIQSFLISRMEDQADSSERTLYAEEQLRIRNLFWSLVEEASDPKELIPFLNTLQSLENTELADQAWLARWGHLPVGEPIDLNEVGEHLGRLPDFQTFQHAEYLRCGSRLGRQLLDRSLKSADNEVSVQEKLLILQRIQHLPRYLSREALLGRVFEGILFRSGEFPPASLQQNQWGSPMSWKVSSRMNLPGCGEKTETYETTGLSDRTLDHYCTRSGKPAHDLGSARIVVGGIATEAHAESVRFSAWAALGVRRQAGGFQVGLTSQPGSADYQMDGQVEIPGCRNSLNCAPVVQIRLGQRAESDSAKVTAEIESKALASITEIHSGETLLLPRSEGPIKIRFKMAGSKTHRFGAAVTPLTGQFAELVVSDASIGIFPEPPKDVSGFVPSQVPALVAATLQATAPQSLAYPSAIIRTLFSSARSLPEFEDRYLVYLGLDAFRLAAQSAGSVSLQSQIELAWEIYSHAAVEAYLPLLETLIRDRRQLLESLPLEEAAQQVLGITNRFWERSTEQEAIINRVRKVTQATNGSPVSSDLRDALQALESLRSSDEKFELRSLAQTRKLHSSLRAMHRQLREELLLFEAEAAQMRSK